MREIKKIIVHCSASDLKEHDSVEVIKQWHVKDNGWNDIGYHYVITKNGDVHQGRPLKEVGAHCSGHNLDSVGVCLTGENEFSPDQFFSLAWLINHLLESNPSINQVKPHSFYNDKKTCSNFKLRIFEQGALTN